MNENKLTPKQPSPNHSMSEQTDNVLILIHMVNTLSEDTKSGDIGSARFVRHMLSELRWLRDQTTQIGDSVESFLNVHPGHSQTRTLQHMLKQITTDIEVTKETFGQLALCAFKERHLLPQYRDHLQTLFHGLYLSLSRLQKQLRRLDQGAQAYAGD